MQITEVLDKLKKLQDILAQKYELEAKINELPKSLDGRNESLDRFKKEFIEKNAEYEEEIEYEDENKVQNENENCNNDEILTNNCNKRITAICALQHEFFNKY